MSRQAYDPAEPLPNPLHEQYAAARAEGLQPKDAATAVGLKDYTAVERRHTFRDRLRVLEALEAPVDATLTLQELVRMLKKTHRSALASRQYRNANDAMEQLLKLYADYPHLRGDAPPASVAVEKQEAAKPKGTRLERRMAHRAALSAVPALPEAEGA